MLQSAIEGVKSEGNGVVWTVNTFFVPAVSRYFFTID
jgi:hypothetical protein